jgi:hypothetical protein
VIRGCDTNAPLGYWLLATSYSLLAAGDLKVAAGDLKSLRESEATEAIPASQ